MHTIPRPCRKSPRVPSDPHCVGSAVNKLIAGDKIYYNACNVFSSQSVLTEGNWDSSCTWKIPQTLSWGQVVSLSMGMPPTVPVPSGCSARSTQNSRAVSKPAQYSNSGCPQRFHSHCRCGEVMRM